MNLFNEVNRWIAQYLGLPHPQSASTTDLYELETGYPWVSGTQGYYMLIDILRRSIDLLLENNPRISILISEQANKPSSPASGYLYTLPQGPNGNILRDSQIIMIAPFPSVSQAAAFYSQMFSQLGATGFLWTYVEPLTVAIDALRMLENMYGNVFGWQIHREYNPDTGEWEHYILVTLKKQNDFFTPQGLVTPKIVIFYQIFTENIPNIDFTSDDVDRIFKFSPTEREFIIRWTVAEFLQYILSIRTSFKIDSMGGKDFSFSPNAEYLTAQIDRLRNEANELLKDLRFFPGFWPVR